MFYIIEFFSDSEIIISINNKIMTSSEIGIECKEVKNIETLQQLLTSLNSIKICTRAISIDNNINIKQSFGIQFEKVNGQWRHKNCSTIVKDDKR